MNPEELLLRDIHLPDPVSWWPPALGWWLVVAAVGLGIGAVVYWRRRQLALRRAPTTLARAELARLQLAWAQNRDVQWLAGEISIWLRRASMSLASRRQAASLTGSQWQQYLNELAGETIFDAADTDLLNTLPYRANTTADVAADGEHILALCQRWLDAAARRVPAP